MNEPPEKSLRTIPFVVHATRGLVRDQKARRRAMVIVLSVALLLIVCGSTLLKGVLEPHEHLGWFIFFWLVCAWLTVTAILLAIFDLLMVTSSARRAERELREQIEHESPRGSSDR